MPIEVRTQIKVFDQEEYHALNKRVLRVVFDVHNDFGRFLDEELAKVEIAARCAELGMVPVEREVGIRVTHDGFAKEYFMDLLLGGGLLMEAKAREAIVPVHRSQTLNYLLLAGMNHGTLVNLRPSRVEHEFISTRLTPERRRQINVCDDRWHKSDQNAKWLHQRVVALMRDWGAFLEVGLYRDALIHFLGGAERVCRPVSLFSGDRLLGTQNLCLLTSESAFALSAITANPREYESHLTRFLRHTRLRELHWINLNHHDIELVSLVNSH